MPEERRKLKVFFIEDNLDDVELEFHELKTGGFDVTFEVARNRNEFLEKLPKIDADIIIADYSLPDITGMEAIHICREKNIDVPIIFITGIGNEQIAVDSLQEGATDYILKKNIVGFSARISRALAIWAERKAKEKAEADRQKLQELLFQSQKMESIGRLASGVAHDFNNIITGILGFAEIIKQNTPENSQAYEGLNTIISLCKNGSALTKQLLMFGRKTKAEFNRVNINSSLTETIGFLKHMLDVDIELRLNLQDNIPDIKADARQLSQVLMNLLLNARDSLEGRGVIELKTEKCRTSNLKGKIDDYVVFSISDTGCGIPEENISKIFEPFFTTKETAKGTGLGLAIVYSIVNAHKGWVDVNSAVGKGTTFKVYLPPFSEESNNTKTRLI